MVLGPGLSEDDVDCRNDDRCWGPSYRAWNRVAQGARRRGIRRRAPALGGCGSARRRHAERRARCRGSAPRTTTRRCSSTRARGARFRDVDGHEYADFNIADMSMFTGYAPEPVVEAVARRMARGTQFLLPNEDAIWVAEELGRRYGLPKWQFTLSATHANTEVDPCGARRRPAATRSCSSTGSTTATSTRPCRARGRRLVPEEAASRATYLPHGDRAVQRRSRPWRGLEPREVAIVITEPAMTNNVGLLLPVEGSTTRSGDHARDRHAARLRRDPHAGRRARRAHADVGPRSRHRHDRQVDRRRRAAGRLRHDRGGRRRAGAAGGRDDEKPHGRDRRHAVRQPAVDGGRARDAWARSSPPTRTPTRSVSARAWPTGSRRRSPRPASRGPRTASGRGAGSRSRRRCPANAREATPRSTSRCTPARARLPGEPRRLGRDRRRGPHLLRARDRGRRRRVRGGVRRADRAN